MTVEAVLFDWGGTLSTYVPVDLLDMWRAAAGVLAPQDPEPLAAALLAAEDAWWVARVGEGDGTGSGTTEQLVRSVARETHLPVQQALEAYHGAWEVTVAHDPLAVPVLQALRAAGCVPACCPTRTGLASCTSGGSSRPDCWTCSTYGSTPASCRT